ncbi:hypothetical protein AB0O58_21095 [Rhodococcus sp. NPDC080181]|uniref:hypothetical protein n=1 Tax=Rhodococcus sp. NPDC080181 TaxID=3155292 RepID=UPI00344EC8A1
MASSVCDRWAAADKAVRLTPGFRFQVGLDVVGSMQEVLERNAYELRAHLYVEDFTNISEKMTDEFVQETVRLLINYCSARSALVDTTRAHIVKLCEKVGGEPARWAKDEYAKETELHFDKPEYKFLQDLRNYCCHYRVPTLNASVKWPVGEGSGDLRHEVTLMAEPMLKWSKWSSPARAYIEQNIAEGIAVVPLVSAYQDDVLAFYDWLPADAFRAFTDERLATARQWQEVQDLKEACLSSRR